MPRHHIAIATTIALLAGAATADAQAPDFEPPPAPTAATVISAGHATLAVADRDDGDIRLVVRGPDGLEDDDDQVPPLWADEAALAHADRFNPDDTRRVLTGGAVVAAVAAVELRYRSGSVRVDTVAGEAYRGSHAGRLRFFLTDTTLPAGIGATPDLVRLFDASGKLLGIRFLGPLPATRSLSLLRGGRWQARLIARPRPAPTPLAPDRLEPEVCVQAGPLLRTDFPEELCRGPEPRPTALRLVGEIGCGPRPTRIAGLVPEGTRELVVVLGSGRRVRLRMRRVPAAFAVAATVVAGSVPRAQALREAIARGPGGRVLARAQLGYPPGHPDCDDGSGDQITVEVRPQPSSTRLPGQVAVAPSGPYVLAPRLVAREQGDHLCIGVDSVPADASTCWLPPVNSHAPDFASAPLVAVPAGSGVLIGGAVAAPVATVELLLRGGVRRRVATVAGEEYTGRYRGHVRFFLAPALAVRDYRGAYLLDAGGRRIGSIPGLIEPDEPTYQRGPRTLRAVRAGGVQIRLLAARSRDAGCFALAIGTSRPRARDCFPGSSISSQVTARALCAPRAVVLFGYVHRQVRRVQLELGSGRRLPAGPLVAFPRALGRAPRSFLVVVPRGESLRALRLVGQGETIRTPVAAAAQQCGYEFFDAAYVTPAPVIP